MAITDLFSRRQKRLAREVTGPAQDQVPQTVRAQVVFLWEETIGNAYGSYFGKMAMHVYGMILYTLAKEYGNAHLGQGADVKQALLDFFHRASTEELST